MKLSQKKMNFSIWSLSTILFLFSNSVFAIEKSNYPSFFGPLVLTIFIIVIVLLIPLIMKVTKELSSIDGKEAKPSLLTRWWQKANNLVSKNEEKKIELDHNYDGIKELNNKIPNWFTFTFLFTIIWGIVYLFVYHVGKWSPLPEEELKIAIVEAEKERKEYLKKMANVIDETNIKISTKSSDISYGKQQFMTSCAVCHAKDGGGGVGPNLTDEYWKHGNTPNDFFKVVKYGVIEKGMTPWKNNYSDVQIVKIVSYLETLKGTTPASPKHPQGEKYTPLKNN